MPNRSKYHTLRVVDEHTPIPTARPRRVSSVIAAIRRAGRRHDDRAGQRIAKKVLREMLASPDHRRGIDEVAERYVASYSQGVAARKHVRVYCRALAKALREMP